MTITPQRGRHAYVPVIELDDTVTLHLPENAPTQRITPPFRRPDATPPRFEQRRSFGYVGDTGEIPLGVQPEQAPVADELQQRFDLFYGATRTADPAYASRHRAPGPFARLLRWIGGRR
jgi:hypothetical protein